MASAQSVKESAEGIHEIVDIVAGKLDEVRLAFIALKEQLAAGVPVTQEQLDALGVSLESLKDKALSLSAKAGSILE